MTKDQIQAEFASFIEYPSEDKRYVTTTSAMLFAEHIARIARAQALKEARQSILCKINHPDDPSNSVWSAAYEHVAYEHAAAIDALMTD